ncbi:hypothetical protein COB55_03970 [Candidatus Wolfebacteria bacterium]|nr:MAG: hypothetical protein COB55_03970 [Candidatus Wolfebacteria bacterium]
MATKITLKLEDQGKTTTRRFSSDVIDYYENDNVKRESIPNYKLSKKKVQETKPKFLSISKGRDFYYLIEDVLIRDVDLTIGGVKTQPPTIQEEKQTKETFDTSKSSKVLDTEVQTRLTTNREQDSIFTTKIDNTITNIDITNQVKKVRMFFPGRDTLNIVIPEDPNELGVKFLLKGSKPLKQGDFRKV